MRNMLNCTELVQIQKYKTNAYKKHAVNAFAIILQLSHKQYLADYFLSVANKRQEEQKLKLI